MIFQRTSFPQLWLAASLDTRRSSISHFERQRTCCQTAVIIASRTPDGGAEDPFISRWSTGLRPTGTQSSLFLTVTLGRWGDGARGHHPARRHVWGYVTCDRSTRATDRHVRRLHMFRRNEGLILRGAEVG